MAMAMASPIADQREKRPPTQSRNSNRLAGSMPKAAVASALLERATKCRPTACPPSASMSQDLAVTALVMVSSVVKVLEATMKRVDAGSSPLRASLIWLASTLATK